MPGRNRLGRERLMLAHDFGGMSAHHHGEGKVTGAPLAVAGGGLHWCLVASREQRNQKEPEEGRPH